MLELIRDLAHNKGVNLILSSHLLPDVEYTCDRVVVDRQGQQWPPHGPIDALKGPAGRVYEAAHQGRQRGVHRRAAPARATSATTPTRT